MPVMMPRNSAS